MYVCYVVISIFKSFLDDILALVIRMSESEIVVQWFDDDTTKFENRSRVLYKETVVEVLGFM